VPLDNYICDFCIVKDKVYIIELNPFATTTDAGLFAWGADEKILKDGPFEFRIVEKSKKSFRKISF